MRDLAPTLKSERCRRRLASPLLPVGMLLLCAAAGAGAQQTGGADIFTTACAYCHGLDGRGIELLAPSLLERVRREEREALAAYLRQGDLGAGMPPAPVDERQMPALLDHLHALADAAEGSDAPAAASVERPRAAPGVEAFVPVTEEMLLSPSPGDWLWFNRTADGQRFSPLAQIDADNAGELSLAWSRGLPDGLSTTTPTVYAGIMYLVSPDSGVLALDATTGDLVWEYRRAYEDLEDPAAAERWQSQTLAIFDDMLYFSAPDSTLVALDASTGEVRWEAPSALSLDSGALAARGLILSGAGCAQTSTSGCRIRAHDALTGVVRWERVLPEGAAATAASAPDVDVGGDGGAGPPGSHDVESGLVYWGVVDEGPGAADDDERGRFTLALDPERGEIRWRHRHAPAVGAGAPRSTTRILLRTLVDPDPEHVAWINPALERGVEKDVAVFAGERGGLWVLERDTGRFLWAIALPFDGDLLSAGIDVDTGTLRIDTRVADADGAREATCEGSLRSAAYSPDRNVLFVAHAPSCRGSSAEAPGTDLAALERRVAARESDDGADGAAGIVKIDMVTGRSTHWSTPGVPSTNRLLATAGDVLFWGDHARRFRAFHAGTGETLWETVLGGPIAAGSMTYAVGGRQYLAVIAGEAASQQALAAGAYASSVAARGGVHGNNSIHVFALPLADAAGGMTTGE